MRAGENTQMSGSLICHEAGFTIFVTTKMLQSYKIFSMAKNLRYAMGEIYEKRQKRNRRNKKIF